MPVIKHIIRRLLGSLARCMTLSSRIPAIAFALGTPAFAQTTTWTGDSTENWFDPGSWTNGVPTSASTAIVGNSNATFTPYVFSSASVNSLSLANGAVLTFSDYSNSQFNVGAGGLYEDAQSSIAGGLGALNLYQSA